MIETIGINTEPTIYYQGQLPDWFFELDQQARDRAIRELAKDHPGDHLLTKEELEELCGN
jgi:hypothetical protein